MVIPTILVATIEAGWVVIQHMVGTLEDGISSCQDSMPSMSKMLDQLLEAIQSQFTMNTPIELSVNMMFPSLKRRPTLS
ncbi:hypothetical protein J1N35_035579 [Gossypium stocksii]|uniref:Uncharacterized protein n=1 Tax=Gossypium stocksii TaxID=47602 RepID=A0A9D3UVY8_9ROSI|nr:hypothetical protein J1N35_035579 [Gossypium stocksii]